MLQGFFIVKFERVKGKDYVLSGEPWFWGNARLFMIPWFLSFHSTTMVVSKMPIWVRTHNLPLHFWHHKVLEGIGNSLAKFIKIYTNRVSKGIFTFARICVEVDFIQGLRDHIMLVHNNIQWTQSLYYENMTFCCRGCLQTGHLQSACSQTKKGPKRRNKLKSPKVDNALIPSKK